MKSPDRLLFGTAGIPLSANDRNTLNGISRVKELGLGAMELEFVHSINISKEKAPEIKEKSQQEDVILTCHAPYFINLNAKEPEKRHASMYRIEKSAEILQDCGGWSVCYHPGFYLDMEKETVFKNVLSSIKEIQKKLQDNGIDVWVRPETTGKPTQFGDYEELLKISQEVEKVMPVFDFSHIHARSAGMYNSREEFNKILENVEKYLGREGLDNMHIHVSGINYTEKGERNHLILEESDMNYKDLVKIWKEFRVKGVVICESPNIEEDALLLQKVYKTG
ncbi:TIM barrel protein [Candidatus Woesearchaeota archaeon]|nr:TIM barrel protein [Candidatus Woesearchaeota archaeon]